MTAKEREALVRLAVQCEDALRDKWQQSIRVYRGDMRAIAAAQKALRQADVVSGGSPRVRVV